MVRGKGFEPSNPYGTGSSSISDKKALEEFTKFCEVDRRLKPRTTKEHLRKLMQLRTTVRKPLCELTHDDLRDYLARFKDASPYHYANILKALRVFYGAFLSTDSANGFKFPEYPLKPRKVPTCEQLRKFYHALKSPFKNQRQYPTSCYRACFLLWASSGRRRNEILGLTLGDIDLEKRMLMPNGSGSSTKRTWVSFYGEEAERGLRRYIREAKISDNSPLFSSKSQIERAFRKASEASGIKITPQVLRDWFACEMGRLEVPDRYVDAFAGRVPRSVLARHYTDFSPERLKEIYDKAGLKVLE